MPHTNTCNNHHFVVVANEAPSYYNHKYIVLLSQLETCLCSYVQRSTGACTIYCLFHLYRKHFETVVIIPLGQQCTDPVLCLYCFPIDLIGRKSQYLLDYISSSMAGMKVMKTPVQLVNIT